MDSNDNKKKTFYKNGVLKSYHEDEDEKTIYHDSHYGNKDTFDLLYAYRSLSMELKEIDRQVYYLIQKNKHNKTDEKMKLKRLYKSYLKDFGCLLEVESYYNLLGLIPLDKLQQVIKKFKMLQKGLETLG